MNPDGQMFIRDGNPSVRTVLLVHMCTKRMVQSMIFFSQVDKGEAHGRNAIEFWSQDDCAILSNRYS